MKTAASKVLQGSRAASNVMPNSAVTVSGNAQYNNNGGPVLIGTVLKPGTQ
jgi:hypothetical protein